MPEGTAMGLGLTLGDFDMINLMSIRFTGNT